MERRVITLGRRWEGAALFSLGVVSPGQTLHTAGITARDADGNIVGVGDMCRQVAQCFATLGAILDAAGATWNDVVKYLIFTTDIVRYDHETREVRAPYFVGKPAATLVEVRRLIHPDMLVEVEAVVSLRLAAQV